MQFLIYSGRHLCFNEALSIKVSIFTAFFLLSIIGKVPILRPNLPVIPVLSANANSGAYLEIEDHGCKSAIFAYILISMGANSKENTFQENINANSKQIVLLKKSWVQMSSFQKYTGAMYPLRPC